MKKLGRLRCGGSPQRAARPQAAPGAHRSGDHRRGHVRDRDARARRHAQSDVRHTRRDRLRARQLRDPRQVALSGDNTARPTARTAGRPSVRLPSAASPE